MKNSFRLTIGLFCIALATLACGSSTPTEAALTPEATATTEAAVATATILPTALPAASLTPTVSRLQLEIVQYQTWVDKYGNLRVNVLFRNTNDYPVQPTASANVSVFDKDGKLLRNDSLYFLDGISGGLGFLLPGETIAANGCFTCEELPLTAEPDSFKFEVLVKDATNALNYFTNVEATVGNVSFEPDSPLFFFSGTVKNNTDQILQNIAARLIVFDQEGNFVGVGTASAYDIGPGGAGSFDGTGFGSPPDGPVKYEISALGVNY